MSENLDGAVERAVPKKKKKKKKSFEGERAKKGERERERVCVWVFWRWLQAAIYLCYKMGIDGMAIMYATRLDAIMHGTRSQYNLVESPLRASPIVCNPDQKIP